jgi:HAD superfamily hydrolase (TIGR01549 family)
MADRGPGRGALTGKDLAMGNKTVILDIDGTLVDTNFHHAVAWFRAFRDHDLTLPLWRIHRHIGMGGDQLVEALAGADVEKRLGDDIRSAEADRYKDLIDEVQPMAGARELIEALKQKGHAVVLASSAKAHELDHYLDLLDVRSLVDGWTSSADVDATKPEPDLVEAALDKGKGDDAVMVGDSTWDCEAARRAGVETIAVLTGGFSEQELLDAGALLVVESVEELASRLPETSLA